jgi:hypothetical protein
LHVPLVQLVGVLWTMSHAFPHPPQSVVVDVDVSHPSVFGAPVLQSAKPGLQLVYLHVVPSQLAPFECSASHLFPHPAQLVMVFVGVSQPSRSGAVVTQSPKPALQV